MKYVQSKLEPIDKCFQLFLTQYGKYSINKDSNYEYYEWKHPNIDVNNIKKIVDKSFKNSSWTPKCGISENDMNKTYTIKNNKNVILICLIKDIMTDTLFLIKDY